jgi:hypothetical protein
MTQEQLNQLCTTLQDCLISPNEADRNLEAANGVDGLFAIARSINGLSQAVSELTDAIKDRGLGT